MLGGNVDRSGTDPGAAARRRIIHRDLHRRCGFVAAAVKNHQPARQGDVDGNFIGVSIRRARHISGGSGERDLQIVLNDAVAIERERRVAVITLPGFHFHVGEGGKRCLANLEVGDSERPIAPDKQHAEILVIADGLGIGQSPQRRYKTVTPQNPRHAGEGGKLVARTLNEERLALLRAEPCRRRRRQCCHRQPGEQIDARSERAADIEPHKTHAGRDQLRRRHHACHGQHRPQRILAATAAAAAHRHHPDAEMGARRGHRFRPMRRWNVITVPIDMGMARQAGIWLQGPDDLRH
ncbi:MAG: hypothetical protein HY052_08040 [Proteobacteria bacterium]|nr:hypothetical protein [Pseudomonadota bacterium]